MRSSTPPARGTPSTSTPTRSRSLPPWSPSTPRRTPPARSARSRPPSAATRSTSMPASATSATPTSSTRPPRWCSPRPRDPAVDRRRCLVGRAAHRLARAPRRGRRQDRLPASPPATPPKPAPTSPRPSSTPAGTPSSSSTTRQSAAKHFAEIERVSQMPLSQSRAEYWLGRTAERAGRPQCRRQPLQERRALPDDVLRPDSRCRASASSSCR